MTVKAAKRNASAAVKDIIDAARRYVEAERQLEEAMRAEGAANSDRDPRSAEQSRSRGRQ
jgi:hypothetical protein